jgi:hypothetical protein
VIHRISRSLVMCRSLAKADRPIDVQLVS